MTELRLQGVRKRFGAVTAVDDLSITVADGEFVVLLGPTGAGKTTTLRLAAGLEKPDSGAVFIGGRDVTALAPAERDVAFVFQQYSLYPHYSVYDNLAFPLRAPGRRWPEDKIRRRVEEIADMLGMAGKLRNRATELSGGEMQRVSIGRALVRAPNVFLMDEPLSSLDAKLRENMRVELKRIQRELGATILYVTHDQLEAMTLADRIGILAEGRLVQMGPPREIYENPASVHAARRLGSPPMNIVPPAALGLAQTPPGTASAGVRPEDIGLGAADGLPARVESVEHLGASMVAVLKADGARLHVLLGPGHETRRGDDVRFSVNRDRIMFFDARDNRLDVKGADQDGEAN